MKETFNKNTKNVITIGLPNALLYSRYQVLWKTFFAALGIETVVSGPTNKETLQLGAENAIDESCLSAKIYLGHIRSLIGKCDYILIPRISNWGASGICAPVLKPYMTYPATPFAIPDKNL